MKQLRYIPELTGLRGVAALMVVIAHIPLVVPQFGEHMADVGESLSWFGMSLFFVLSGVVICYNYADRIKSSPRNGIACFLLARFARLYPLYLCFILFFISLNLIRGNVDSEYYVACCASIPIFLAGLQSWFCGFINGQYVTLLQGSGNISWSISTEFALYLFFIPIVRIGYYMTRKSKRIRNTLPFVLLVCSLLGHIIWMVLCNYGMPLLAFVNSIYPGHKSEILLHFTYHSPLARTFEFLSGCAIAMLLRDGKLMNYRIAVVGRIICVVFFIVIGCAPLYGRYFVSCLMVLLCAFFSLRGSSIMRSRVFQFIGDVSYSAYLLHIMVVLVLRHFPISSGVGAFIKLAIYFVATYLLAWISYQKFESPMRLWIKGNSRYTINIIGK